jgi:hypothetical protein
MKNISMFFVRVTLITTVSLLLSQAVRGAIGVDATAFGDQGTPTTTVSTSPFSTTSGNELLLAFVSGDQVSSSALTVTQIAGGGLTWVLVRRTNTQKGTSEIWRAFASSALSGVTVTATLSQSVCSSMTVMSFTGVNTSGTNGSGAVGATGTGNANPGQPTATLVTTGNGSLVLGVGNDWDNPIGRTVPAGQSLVHQYFPPVGDTYWVQMQSSPTVLSGTSVTINDTGPATDRYNLSTVEVLAAAGGVTTGTINGTISQTGTISGATVQLLQGTTLMATANVAANGSYTFSNVANGTYTLQPSESGFTFNPTSQPVTVSGNNATVPAFTATALTFAVSGTISPASAALDTTLRLSQNGTIVATTSGNSSGTFTFSNIPNGTYTVTPTSSADTFSPGTQSVTISGANVSGVSFTAQSIQSVLLAIDVNVSFDASSRSASLQSPVFSTTGTNELLLVFVATDYLSGANTSVTNVTGAGLTWALVKRSNTQSGGAEIWRAFSTATLTNVSVTAALSQSVESSITVLSFTGADRSGTNGSGAIGAVGGASASSGAPTATLVTTRSNSWVFAVANDYDNAIIRIPGAGQKLVHQDLAPVNDTYWVQMQNSPTPLSGTTVMINDTAPTRDRYNLAIVEVLPALNQVSQAFGISGAISPTTSGSGATITLSGAASTTTTANSSGAYSFTGLANGGYAVTPSKTDYSFQPSTQAVTINNASVTGVNFTATAQPPTFTISGTISPATIGSGTVLKLSGTASGMTTADSSGNYSFTGLANGSYTVTPTSTTATFSPKGQTVSINNGNVGGVNFTASGTSNVIFFDDFTGNALDTSKWTVIQRHGEYAQSETECNTAQQVSVANSKLTITTAVGPAPCGDFNTDGSVRHTPQSWPYVSGDVQWTNLNFRYGTIEVRAQFPPQAAGVWPAIWMLGQNCQQTNIYTADTGYETCPVPGTSGYQELDIVECDPGGPWCHVVAYNGSVNPETEVCRFAVDTNWHVYTMAWANGSLALSMDGQALSGCSISGNAVPSNPMFLLLQTQTADFSVFGPPNNRLLPTTFNIDYVKVTQP